MIKTIEELKDLIIFAREQKLKSLKIGGVSIEVSDLAHVSELTNIPEMGVSKNPSVTASIGGLLDELGPQDEDDDELLNWSSRP